MAHTGNPSYLGSRDQEDGILKPAWANSLWNPISKKPNTNRAGGLTQVIECLPSKHEALSSNPNTAKTKTTTNSRNSRKWKDNMQRVI
jgi:hypothetical protein